MTASASLRCSRGKPRATAHIVTFGGFTSGAAVLYATGPRVGPEKPPTILPSTIEPTTDSVTMPLAKSTADASLSQAVLDKTTLPSGRKRADVSVPSFDCTQ